MPQIVGIAVPAHDVANINAMTFGDARQRITFANAIGDAIAVIRQTLRAAAGADNRVLSNLQSRAAQVIPLLQIAGRDAETEAIPEMVSPERTL